MSIKRALVALVAVAAAVAAAVLLLSERERSGAPNVILISVDTLRPDHLGCYGYGRDTSPSLDRFASECALFENAYSHAPLTGPACASFLTGFLPHETRVLQNNAILPASAGTLAETLGAHGYETYGVVCNYVLREDRGFEQGFDVFDADLDAREEVRDKPERIAESATTRVLEILRRRRGERLFLWIHYQDPHGPYTPPAPFDTLYPPEGEPRPLEFCADNSGKGGIPKYQQLGSRTDYEDYVQRYDGEIRYLDGQLGRLFSALKEMGLYETSLIIFTADHGEALGENGYFFAHGHRLDRCLLHVPLLVKAPGLAPGRRGEPVQHLDIAPTILRAAGIAGEPRLRGHDLLSPRPEGGVIFSELREKSACVLSQGMKLVFEGADTLLFDVLDDPGEGKNLAREPAHAGRLAALAGELNRLRAQDLLGIASAPGEPGLTAEEEEALRALGYVD